MSQNSDNSHHFDALLKGSDVAKILNVSRSYAFLLMERDEIPTVRIGRTVRVRPSDLERFISQNVSRADKQEF
jgi:excisionase family DNA binding protein